MFHSLAHSLAHSLGLHHVRVYKWRDPLTDMVMISVERNTTPHTQHARRSTMLALVAGAAVALVIFAGFAWASL